MVDRLAIMIAAVIIAAGVMIVSAGPISGFVDRHPTIKMLALSFLLLIGFTLIVEGLHQHIPKGYIYFAMAFSIVVELLNLRLRKVRAEPVKLREAYVGEQKGDEKTLSSCRIPQEGRTIEQMVIQPQEKIGVGVFDQFGCISGPACNGSSEVRLRY